MGWIPQAAAVFIAACAAWIAAQQMIIARLKLNHDLFDRRFKVFAATHDFMVAILNHDGGTREDHRAFYEATREAPFLFDNNINKFLQQVMEHAVSMQISGEFRSQPRISDYERFMEQYHGAQLWVAGEYERLTSRFQPSMNLLNLTPFSVQGIVPISDPKATRERLLASPKERG